MLKPSSARRGRARRRGLSLASYAAAVTLVLTGTACDDSPAPDPLEQSSGSPSPTATPTPGGPPTLPAEAEGTSKKAAEAFVRYWIDAFNYSVATADARLLSEASTRCAACDAVIALIERVERRGGTIETEGWTVESVESLDSDVVQVRTVVDSAPQVFRVPGEKVQRFSGGRSVKTFTLTRKDGSWRVSYLDQS